MSFVIGITLAVPVREVNDSASTASSKAESTDNEYTPKDDKGNTFFLIHFPYTFYC